MVSTSDDHVLIFDTTLRDGEQSPGASMSVAEKIRIAKALENLQVDIIEAGFAAASKAEVEALQAIGRELTESVVCSLTRSVRQDIDIAVEALKTAKRKRIHNFIATSHLHMKHKLQMTPDQVLQSIQDSVSYARNFVDDVEWSCEDGTRSDPEFLKRCFDTAIRAGATTVNIADTVGYTMPEEFTELITMLRNSVAGMERVRFSVHCHNDLGMAVANSLAAIKAGARQVECTINGLGERAGNASLEEIVMAIRTRKDLLEVETRVDPVSLTETSKMVSEASGFLVPPNKAIVGKNAFAHESGIHQHGVIKHRGTYEIICPEEVGAGGSTLVLGKHSGKHALAARLNELGYVLGNNALEDIFVRFKDLADQKGELNDVDLVRLIENDATDMEPEDNCVLSKLELSYLGEHRYQIITHLLIDGVMRSTATEAQTPVQALLLGIRTLLPEAASTTLNWRIVKTPSDDVLVRAVVKAIASDKKYVEEASSPETVFALARAYLAALSRWRREKS